MSEELITWHIEDKNKVMTVQSLSKIGAWRLWFGHPFGSSLSFDLSIKREEEQGTKAVKTVWIKKASDE